MALQEGPVFLWGNRRSVRLRTECEHLRGAPAGSSAVRSQYMERGGCPAAAGLLDETLAVRGTDGLGSGQRREGSSGPEKAPRAASLKSLTVTGHRQAWAGLLGVIPT